MTTSVTPADQDLYTAGQAAQQAGVTRKAIRTWEDKGLLPPAERTEAGHRLFTDNEIAVLRFIRQAKTLGLTLAEINDILALQRGGAQPGGRVTQLLDAHIDQPNCLNPLSRARVGIDEVLADVATRL